MVTAKHSQHTLTIMATAKHSQHTHSQSWRQPNTQSTHTHNHGDSQQHSPNVSGEGQPLEGGEVGEEDQDRENHGVDLPGCEALEVVSLHRETAEGPLCVCVCACVCV